MGWLIAQTGVESLQGLTGLTELVKANPEWSTIIAVLTFLVTYQYNGVPLLQYLLENCKGETCKQVARTKRTRFNAGGKKAVAAYEQEIRHAARKKRFDERLAEEQVLVDEKNEILKASAPSGTAPQVLEVDKIALWDKVADEPEPKKFLDMIKTFLAKFQDMCGGNIMMIVVIAVVLLMIMGKGGCTLFGGGDVTPAP